MYTYWKISIPAFLSLVFILTPLTVPAGTIYLDADTVATGSQLDTAPLDTPFGTISFSGRFIDSNDDPEFYAAGARGNSFSIDSITSLVARFDFGFEASSISFLYGGNAGGFDVQVMDIDGLILDSFFQASTDEGEPVGPITLYGSGIRSMVWSDPDPRFYYSLIDNVTIKTPVPEPSTFLLLGGGLAGLAFYARRRKKE